MRNSEDFATFAKSNNKENEFNLIFDKVVMQDRGEAYAYYTISTGLIERKSPAIKMEFVGGSWRINGFANYFRDDCVVDSCYDSNVCTNDLCSKETKYLCVNEKIVNCCLNNNNCPYYKPYCHDNICLAEECLENSDCSYSRPICSGNNKCVECTKNSDCSGDKDVCDTLNSKCVICLTDTDCDGWYSSNRITGEWSNDLPYCINKECEQCRTDDDCGEKEFCTSYYYCDEAKCMKDSDCTTSDKPYCRISSSSPYSNECVECVEDNDCKDPDEPYCQKDFYNCKSSMYCEDDNDCKDPDEPYCWKLINMCSASDHN